MARQRRFAWAVIASILLHAVAFVAIPRSPARPPLRDMAVKRLLIPHVKLAKLPPPKPAPEVKLAAVATSPATVVKHAPPKPKAKTRTKVRRYRQKRVVRHRPRPRPRSPEGEELPDWFLEFPDSYD